MSKAIRLPLLSKPLYGSPCNGCGLCCQLSLCEVAEAALPPHIQAPCPFLEYELGRTWCGLARDPAKHLNNPQAGKVKPLMERYFGHGCGMEDRDAIEAAQ